MMGLQPFDPLSLVIIAVLNPAVIVVAVLMGRAADQWQKLVVAGFTAALAGSALIWLATFLDILPAKGLGGEGGLFVLHFLLGLTWAAIAYRARGKASL